jgi:hypothetical protein
MNRSVLLTLCALPLFAQANLSVTFRSWNEYCGNNNGRIEAVPAGGQAPYTYSWDNGGTTEVITDLDAGTYTLTLTDDLGAEVVQDVTITDEATIQIPDFAWTSQTMYSGYIAVSMAGTRPCAGQCNGGYAWSEIAYTPTLVQPITYNPTPTEMQGFGPIFIGYCEGEYPYLEITDGTGCVGSFPIDMIVGTGSLPMSIISIEPACGPSGSVTYDPGNGAIGTIDLLDGAYQPTGQFQFAGGTGQMTFNGLAPGDYILERIEDLTYYDCPEYLPFTVPSVGSPCGTVSGTIFLDHDQDCAQDVNDEPLVFKVLEVLPGPQYTITDQNGHYDLGMVYGGFTIDQQAGSDLYQICPVGAQVPFTIDAGNTDVVVDFADSSLIPLDIEAHLHTDQIRPGFAVNIWGSALNLSGQLSGALDFTLTFDPALSYVSADPSPSSVVGNVVTWTGLAGLSAFGGRGVHVLAQVPPDPGLIGTDLSFTLDVSQPFTETSLANNAITYTRTVTGSYDPNEKAVRTSSGSQNEFIIEDDTYLDYTVDFQNTGTDTAFTVVVTDTLSEELDMATFQQIAASHVFDIHFLPDRVVEWRFENVLLADSNTNEPASHGFVQFRIRPTQPWLPGTTITNNADIFFDFNPPVRTNDAVMSLESSTQVVNSSGASVRVYPNPAHDLISLMVPVAGSKPLRAEIRASDGRLCQVSTLQQHDIDISELRAGAYTIVLHLTDGERIIRPFIKY